MVIFEIKIITMEKNKVGRPLEGLDLYDGWQDDVLEKYRDGASDVEIRAHIWEARGSISQSLWERWLRDEPEFRETIQYGRMLSNVWWEQKGRKNLDNKDFSPTLWYMNMKNRFGWRDKTEIDNTSSDGSMSPKKTIITFTKSKKESD